MAKPVTASRLGCDEDTYFLSLAQNSTLATIGSDDYLRLFDASLRGISTANVHGSGLACLKVFDEKRFATAGRDGIVRLFDQRAKQTSQLNEPQGRPISTLACRENIIAIGTDSPDKEGLGDVSVLLFDARNPSLPLRQYNESHSDSITQLAFHPTQPNALLSGSTDGLVSIFDVTQADEDEALQQVLNPRGAVHCAGFLTADQAYVLTTDEKLLIYPLAEPVEGVEPAKPQDLGDCRESLDCMYVIDLLRQPDGQPLIAYGHNERQTLSVVQMNGSEPSGFGERKAFPGAHGEEVVRDVLLADSRAYSCGEDGQVKVWKW
ncbi:hypothetical protein B0A50_00830 [Salinomyces thailandicus]|uniref:Uncharacterized protein n=1 Tax=Salinomyces thailandicus TaxID=706561 RepID=A0A4U0UDC7_9PEZI|nr:hypothetical protein B0A50_00830 [Salinomyces thailandica]